MILLACSIAMLQRTCRVAVVKSVCCLCVCVRVLMCFHYLPNWQLNLHQHPVFQANVKYLCKVFQLVYCLLVQISNIRRVPFDSALYNCCWRSTPQQFIFYCKFSSSHISRVSTSINRFLLLNSYLILLIISLEVTW